MESQAVKDAYTAQKKKKKNYRNIYVNVNELYVIMEILSSMAVLHLSIIYACDIHLNLF